MRLCPNQIEANKYKPGCFFGVQAEVLLFGSRMNDKQRGFTMVELIMTMVIIGILAAVVAPRFFDNNIFQSRGFADQVKSTLRYAQKVAVSQHRNVCVVMTASAVTLTIAATSGPLIGCGPNLDLPAGGNSITAPSGVTLSPAVIIIFDALGATTPARNITVSDGTNNIAVAVENVTGYVH